MLLNGLTQQTEPHTVLTSILI